MKKTAWLVLALFICIATSGSAVEIVGVEASSCEGPGLEVENVCDGDYGTRFSTKFKDNQEIVLDLGSVQEVSEVEINWENAYATKFSIDVSEDKISWFTVYEEKDGNGGVDICRLAMFEDSVKARYVRINLIERVNKDWGFSAFEIILR